MPTSPYSPLRSKLSRKPWIKHAALHFWHCDQCARLLHEYLGEDQTPDPSEISGEISTAPPSCCGHPMRILHPQATDGTPNGTIGALGVDYEIIGGFNNNAVKVHWNRLAVHRPLWIALQTYTGVYLKHIGQAKFPPVIFPLSDEDAYAYCDKAVCEQCYYCCKKGCVIYVYTDEGTLISVKMDKISQYFMKNKT